MNTVLSQYVINAIKSGRITPTIISRTTLSHSHGWLMISIHFLKKDSRLSYLEDYLKMPRIDARMAGENRVLAQQESMYAACMRTCEYGYSTIPHLVDRLDQYR